MNKKTLIFSFIISLMIIIPLAAQIANNDNQSEINQQTNPADSLDVQPKKYLPVHHIYLPRRPTVISLDRFEEDINLDKKIKQSNQLLD